MMRSLQDVHCVYTVYGPIQPYTFIYCTCSCFIDLSHKACHSTRFRYVLRRKQAVQPGTQTCFEYICVTCLIIVKFVTQSMPLHTFQVCPAVQAGCAAWDPGVLWVRVGRVHAEWNRPGIDQVLPGWAFYKAEEGVPLWCLSLRPSLLLISTTILCFVFQLERCSILVRPLMIHWMWFACGFGDYIQPALNHAGCIITTSRVFSFSFLFFLFLFFQPTFHLLAGILRCIYVTLLCTLQ